jgi:hypothetical protein
MRGIKAGYPKEALCETCLLPYFAKIPTAKFCNKNCRYQADRQKIRTRLRTVFHSILARCTKPTAKGYDRYGGRGIRCEWTSLDQFVNDMAASYRLASSNVGSRNIQLDRRDNNRNYSKRNCHWVTARQNSRNRRDNVLIAWHGKTKTLAEWAEQAPVKYITLHYRLRIARWSMDRAMTVANRQAAEGV